MQCFFPQYVASDISTPIFIVNAAYDSWQVRFFCKKHNFFFKGEVVNTRYDILVGKIVIV